MFPTDYKLENCFGTTWHGCEEAKKILSSYDIWFSRNTDYELNKILPNLLLFRLDDKSNQWAGKPTGENKPRPDAKT